MTYDRLVQIGRVVFISSGPLQGKIAAITEIIDGNRALIDGPGFRKRSYRYKNVHLTRMVIPIRHGAKSSSVKKAWETAEISKKWEESNWAKKLKMRELRSGLSDFDRFKLMKAKQARNRLVRTELGKLKKDYKKNPPAKKVKKPKVKKAAAPAKTQGKK